MRTTRLVPTAFVLIAAALARSADAAKLHVPGDHPHLQAAVDAAAPGDQIIVHEGSYTRVNIFQRTDLWIVGKGEVWLDPIVDPSFGVRIAKSSGIVIDNIRVRDTTGDAFLVTESADVLIRGCEARNVGRGLFVWMSDHISVDGLVVRDSIDEGANIQATDDLLLADCDLRDAGGSGVFVTNCVRVVLDRLHIEDADRGIDVLSSDDVDVLGCSIRHTLSAGIAFMSCDRPRALGDVIEHAGGAGVQVDTSSTATVAENHVDKAGGSGLWVTSTPDALVCDNTVERATWSGIEASSSTKMRVAGNLTDRSGLHGISIWACDDASLHDNRAARSDADGFHVAASANVTLVGNEEKKSGQASHSTPSSTNLLMVDNSFGAPVTGQVHQVPGDFPTIQLAVDASFEGDVIQVKKGVFDGFSISGKDGIVIRGKKGTWIEGHSSDPAVEVAGCRGVVLDRIGVRKTPGDAIHVTASQDVVVSRCRVDDADGAGIVADGAVVRVEKNKIQDAGFPALEVLADRGLVLHNKLTGAGVLRVSGEAGWIAGNKLKGGATMFVTSAPDVGVHANVVKSAGSHLLHVDKSDRARITANQVRGDASTGLRVTTAHFALLHGNDVDDANIGVSVLWSDAPRAAENEVDDVGSWGMTFAYTDDLFAALNLVDGGSGGFDAQSSSRAHLFGNKSTAKKRGFHVKFAADNCLLGNVSKKGAEYDLAVSESTGLVLVGNKFHTTAIQ